MSKPSAGYKGDGWQRGQSVEPERLTAEGQTLIERRDALN